MNTEGVFRQTAFILEHETSIFSENIREKILERFSTSCHQIKVQKLVKFPPTCFPEASKKKNFVFSTVLKLI